MTITRLQDGRAVLTVYGQPLGKLTAEQMKDVRSVDGVAIDPGDLANILRQVRLQDQ
jgi:hypothetical protein